MLPLRATPHTSTTALIKRFIAIADHFGFQNLLVHPTDHTLEPLAPARVVPVVLPHEAHLARALKQHITRNAHRLGEPTLIYQLPSRISGSRTHTELHIIGVESTTAEMLLIATAATFLRDVGVPSFTVHINSLGDRESKLRFLKDLSAYLTEYRDTLPAAARTYLNAKNPVRALLILKEKSHPLVEAAPNPMEYLNDESRTHLRDILEFLEFMDIDYELEPLLVGSPECWQHTLFTISIADKKNETHIVARGGRYSTLARRLYNRRFATVGMLFEYELRGTKAKRIPPPTKKQPAAFLAYVSNKAKLHALAVLSDFYRAGIPIYNAFAHEFLSKQMQYARSLKVPYVILIGHKEALEGTAIVRNNETMSQKIVPISSLPSYLKRLKPFRSKFIDKIE